MIVLQSETGSLTRVSTRVCLHVTPGKVSHSLVAHVCAHTNTHSDIHNTQTPDKHTREKIVECIRMDTGHQRSSLLPLLEGHSFSDQLGPPRGQAEVSLCWVTDPQREPLGNRQTVCGSAQ